LLSLALATALPCLAVAREVEPSRPSSTLVTLELRLGESAPVAITVRDGELATIEHAELGYRIGLIPRLPALADEDVEIDVVAPPRFSDGAPERLYERVRGRVGFSSFTGAGGTALEIKVQSVGEGAPMVQPCGRSTAPSSSAGPGPDGSPERMPVGGCCIICQGMKSCGCAVATACGTCCGCSFCQ
jgi:hypothetical protein